MTEKSRTFLDILKILLQGKSDYDKGNYRQKVKGDDQWTFLFMNGLPAKSYGALVKRAGHFDLLLEGCFLDPDAFL